MNTQIALLVVTTGVILALGLFAATGAYAEHSYTKAFATSLGAAESAPPAFVLAAQAYGGASRRNSLWNGVYGSSLGVNPDYGTYKTYGPFYNQTGGYYGSMSQYCDWNGLYPFCYDYTDNFYLGR
jgi:hypothetical protein